MSVQIATRLSAVASRAVLLQSIPAVEAVKRSERNVEDNSCMNTTVPKLDFYGMREHQLSLQQHFQKNQEYFQSDKEPAAAVAPPEESSRLMSYFESLPFREWADSLGERLMPVFQAIREDKKKEKGISVPEIPVPRIPHLLPFTHWAANSEGFKETFVVESVKDLPKARLSWYHPDDTMVPRDWFTKGLLQDLKYYKPFSTKSGNV